MFQFRVAALGATLSLVAGFAAVAGPIQPFTEGALKKAQAEGKPVLVDVHADWCPICKAQGPTIDAISKDPAFASLVILKLDFDHQAAEKRDLHVQTQSTLIAFKGATETARSVGVTDAHKITDLARTTLR